MYKVDAQLDHQENLRPLSIEEVMVPRGVDKKPLEKIQGLFGTDHQSCAELLTDLFSQLSLELRVSVYADRYHSVEEERRLPS